MKHLFFILLFFPVIYGCGGNNPQGRVAVRGEVTLDNKPLEKGDILFSSIAGTTPMVVTGTPIRNGKFSLSAKQGLIPDQTYSVQFRSVEIISDTQNEIQDPTKTESIRRSLIPRRYGAESKETVIVTKKSPNVFQFDLTSDVGK
jgi:hypothetical protein